MGKTVSRVWTISALSLFLAACFTDAQGSKQASDAGFAGDASEPTIDGAGPRACPLPERSETNVVRTQAFHVRGRASEGVVSFLGVPYAAPPVGELRYRPPEPVACREETLAATDHGARCPQYEDGKVTGDEDCLTLNLWVPEQATKAPVMFWVHGGAHEQGSGIEPVYAGQALAERYGVVVVTFNYRLGPLGFLAHPALTKEGREKASGNYGSLDQLAALQWVHDNIAAFGGDPERVMLFGQSAGGVSVCSLVASPLAKGLFSAAVIQSGACTASPLASAEEAGVEVARKLGCKDASDVATCLRSKTTAEVMATLEPAADGTTRLKLSYGGVVDGYFAPDVPRKRIAAKQHNAVPIIIGTTSSESGRDTPLVADADEFRTYVQRFFAGVNAPASAIEAAVAAYPVSEYEGDYRKALVALTSDAKFVCTARMEARNFAAAQTEPVYHYWFDDVFDTVPRTKAFGAFHGIDVVYTFGNFDALSIPASGSDERVAALLQGYWTRLAESSDPNEEEGVLVWPAYTGTKSMALRDPGSIVEDVRGKQCDFWDALVKP